MCSVVMLLLKLMCSAVMIVAGINVKLLLKLMRSAVMIVAGINVFCCDVLAGINVFSCDDYVEIRCRFVCCAAKFCFAAATEPAATN